MEWPGDGFQVAVRRRRGTRHYHPISTEKLSRIAAELQEVYDEGVTLSNTLIFDSADIMEQRERDRDVVPIWPEPADIPLRDRFPPEAFT
jgi:hypothetical protein